MHDEIPFGRWVKQLRAALDLTQDLLAERVGCSVETIRKVESGERRPSRQVAERMAQALELPPEERAAFMRAARLQHDRGMETRPSKAAEGRPVGEAGQPAPQAAEPPGAARLAPLPIALTPFVGREAELAELARLLTDPASRLITLIGPGGIGKTRLALQAAERQASFAHGVAFVALAPVGSIELIAPAIAQALGLAFSGAADPKAQLLRYLRDKELLLLLDNFEHLLDGVDLLTDILSQAPGVKLLVTSRERLLMQREWIVELQGLTVPDSDQSAGTDGASAVALFVDRARRVKSGFTLSAAESASVVRICRLVEGLPLGIELAAAWARTLSCAEIAQEIARNLDFLAAAARDLPERHRSLRAVFTQSWNLLSDQDRQVLRRLSVFRGNFSREAAASVVLSAEPSQPALSTQHSALLPILVGLIDKSLLRREAASGGMEGRYDMHELIRQYAGEQLRLAGEDDQAHEQHARYYLALAEEAEPHFRGAGQELWRHRLELEHDNLRAALAWSLAAPGGAEIALRLAGALWRFWELHSHFSEGRQWIERALERREEVPAPVRAKALCGIGVMTEAQEGLEARSIALLEESLALRREIGDGQGVAESLLYLGRRMRNQGDYGRAIALETESLALFRSQRTTWGMAWALLSLGDAMLDQGDLDQAIGRFEEAIDLARAQGDNHTGAWACCNLGRVAHRRGDDARAIDWYNESLALFQEIGSLWGRAETLCELGRAARSQGDDALAAACYHESLALLRELEGTRLISLCLEGIAGLAGARGQPAQAARLFGAAAALREAFGPPVPPVYRASYERDLDVARTQTDAVSWAAAWAAGRTLPLEQAIDEALRGVERYSSSDK